MNKIILVIVFSLSSFSYADSLPKPWYQSNLEQYEAGVVFENDARNSVGYLKSTTKKGSKSNVLQHISPPEEWLGRRVRLSGFIRTEITYGYAYMFMSITHGYGYKTYDDMPNQRIIGQTDWQQLSIVLDVPREANADILFGVSFLGKGEIFFDEFRFEVVGNEVEVTGKTEEKSKKSGPSNLSFEYDEAK